MTRTALRIGSLALAGLAALTPPSPLVRTTPIAGYDWPLLPGPDRVIRDFDPPPHPWLAGNRGVDLAGSPGQAVHTANSGVVSFAGPVGGVGAVSVTFGALRTTYEPVIPAVRAGQRVQVGDVIGRLSGRDLHWGLLRGTDYLDPLALLGLEQVRLLPLDAS
jgi:murein DD-endopeptidase MepM/ murein hydrolase activator NlpD